MRARPLHAVLGAVLMTAAMLAFGPAGADQNDARLDRLFAELHETKDSREAQALQGLIWSIWTASGSDTIDLLMGHAGRSMQARRFEDGLKVLDAVVELAPEFAEGWNKRATLHYMMGEYQKSIADCERVLDLEPRHFGALSGLGLIYDALENGDAALSSYERALAVNPHLDHARQKVRLLKKKLRGERI